MKCDHCDRDLSDDDINLRCCVEDCKECFHSIEEARGHFAREGADLEHAKFSPFEEMPVTQLDQILDLTIKHDDVPKTILFFSELLAQTENEQFNSILSGGSAEGKTYLALETLDFFPDHEKVVLSYSSPTAFYHEYGVRVIESPDPGGSTRYIPIEEEMSKISEELEELKSNKKKTQADKDRIRELNSKRRDLVSGSKRLIDLEHKIVTFLDQQNPELLKRMRAFFSHDLKFIEFSITNRSTSGRNQTEKIILVGYASVIFCTAGTFLDEQESTRNLLISPDVSQEKLRESLKLITVKKANPERFERMKQRDQGRKALMLRIALIRASKIRKFNSEDLAGKVEERFTKTKDKLTPRDQRDFPRVWCLVYGNALLNCFLREKQDEETIVINDQDVETAFSLYEPVRHANELGVTPEVFSLYRDVIYPKWYKENRGLSALEIIKENKTVTGTLLSFKRLKEQLLPTLIASSLLKEEQDESDGRRRLYSCEYFDLPTPSGDISPHETKAIAQTISPAGVGTLEYHAQNSEKA